MLKPYKRIFEKNNFSIQTKKYGKFVLEEMAMIDGLISFLIRSKHKFDIDHDNYWETEEWNNFKKFLVECLKYYKGKTTAVTFVEILDKEKVLYDTLWNSLSDDDKQKLMKFAKILDDDWE